MHISGKIAEITGLKNLAAAGSDLKNLQFSSAAVNLIESVCRLSLSFAGVGIVFTGADIIAKALRKPYISDLIHENARSNIHGFCSELYKGVNGVSDNYRDTQPFAQRCTKAILSTNDEQIFDVISKRKSYYPYFHDRQVLEKTVFEYCKLDIPEFENCDDANQSYSASSAETRERVAASWKAACEPKMLLRKVEKCFNNLLETSATDPTLHRLLGTKEVLAYRKARGDV